MTRMKEAAAGDNGERPRLQPRVGELSLVCLRVIAVTPYEPPPKKIVRSVGSAHIFA